MASDDHPWPAPLADAPVTAVVTVPGSKSLTNRALLLAAIADGPSTVTGALRARDTVLMGKALGSLGVRIDGLTDGDDAPIHVAPGPRSPARRTSTAASPARSCASSRRSPPSPTATSGSTATRAPAYARWAG